VSVSPEAVLRAYEEARKFLGYDTPGIPIPRDELVAQLEAEGYDRNAARDAVALALGRGDIVHDESSEIDNGVRPGGYGNEDEVENPEAESESEGLIEREDETTETDSRIPEDRVLEAFETAVDFMCGRLDNPLPEDCDVDAETPREYFEEVRGWDSETVEEKSLGYAPKSPTALLDELMEEGYTREEILATGLFYEGLTPHFQGRVVLPYFDDDGRPCYAISRSIGHPKDPKSEQKYTKAVKTKEYSRVDEPIYGLETLEEDTDTVLVAEGIADAITAHELGYAAISPVTTQFKQEHHDVLLEAVEDTDARVVVVADNDAVASDINDEGSLEIQQHGEGVKGALRTADFLSEKGVDARVALPPTVAHHDNDLDEFLSDGWGTLDHLVAGAKPPQRFDAYDAAVDGQNHRDNRDESEGDSIDTSTSTTQTVERGDIDAGSALFELTISDVLGVSEGYRGENPLGHDGGSRKDYFVVTDRENAYDHKRKVGYTPLTALLVDAGERPVTDPRGELDDSEVFAAWRYAKESRYIPEDDPIPRRALHYVAEEATDWDGELVEHETHDGKTFEGLPTDVYQAALDYVEEEYGLDTGRRRREGARGDETGRQDGEPYSRDITDREDSKPIAAISNSALDLLDEDERRRAARRRGSDVPTTDEARRRLEERIVEAVTQDEEVVLDAPTALGKSHTVATKPWRGVDDQPVVHLHATRDARDEAMEASREANVKAKKLKGRREACPVARGDYDPRDEKIEYEPITVDGTPASEWFDAVCEGRGIPFSTAHSWLKDRLEEEGRKMPCCADNGECPAVKQWEDVPRTDSGEPAYDVIHATHAMAHVPSLTLRTNVFFDEQPDFTVDLSQDRIRRAVTAYLKEVEAPVRSFEHLVRVSQEGFSGNEHAADGRTSPSDQREDFLEALEQEPSRDWYIQNDDAHVLAPALAKAIYYVEKRGNGRRAATVSHEPPTLYAQARDEEDWNRQWLTVVLDEDNTVRSLRNTPSLGLAESVVGLDAHPSMPLWHRVYPSLEKDEVLEPEERRLWRRYERGLQVVQAGDATRPLSGDKAREWFGEDRVRALVEHLDDVHDGALRTGITSMAVEDLLRDVLDETVDDDIETMHYGEEKSRNDFADETVGFVNGCIDPGDGFVLDLLAELDLDAEPAVKETENGEQYRAPGREFVGPDAETAQEILASVRENHVAQAAGRYARDPDTDDGAVVYVRTDAMPPGFADEQVPGVAWAFGEKQAEIVEYLRDNPGSTAREISEATGASKRHVQKTLKRLVDEDLVTVREAAAKHGASVFSDCDANPDGVVDISGEEIAKSDIWDSCMWEFAVSEPSYARNEENSGSYSPTSSSSTRQEGPDSSLSDFAG
jgi:hypothetical protein